MKLRHAVIAALLGSSFLSTAQAALFDFSFTFSNRAFPFSGGTVTGIVRGLTDNAVSAASSVEITGNSDGFGLGEYVGNPSTNLWLMSGGALTAYTFRSFGSSNSQPDVTCCTLSLNSSSPNGFALSNSSSGASLDQRNSSITFTRLVTAVPEPDMFWLLGVSAVGIGASVRQSRRSSAAAHRA